MRGNIVSAKSCEAVKMGCRFSSYDKLSFPPPVWTEKSFLAERNPEVSQILTWGRMETWDQRDIPFVIAYFQRLRSQSSMKIGTRGTIVDFEFLWLGNTFINEKHETGGLLLLKIVYFVISKFTKALFLWKILKRRSDRSASFSRINGNPWGFTGRYEIFTSKHVNFQWKALLCTNAYGMLQ